MQFARRAAALVSALVVAFAGVEAVEVATPVHATDTESPATATIVVRTVGVEHDHRAAIKVWRRQGAAVELIRTVWPEHHYAHGWYRVGGLPRGVELTVSRPGGSGDVYLGDATDAASADWFTIPTDTSFLRLPPIGEVEAPTSLVGRFTDLQGRPWSGRGEVTVRTWVRRGDEFILGPWGRVRDGTFRINGLRPGTDVTVGVRPEDAPVPRTTFLGGASTPEMADIVTIKPRETMSVGALRAPVAAAWVTGRVVEDDGFPVWGAGVTQHWGPAADQLRAEARADTDGRFGVHVAWGDAIRLSFTPEYDDVRWVGGDSYDSATVVAPVDEELIEVAPESIQRTDKVVRGVLRDEAGRPVGGAAVSLETDTAHPEMYASSNADGVFQVRHLSEGVVYRLRSSHLGQVGVVEGVEAGSDRVVQLPDLTLEATLPVVRGRLVHEDPNFDLDGISFVRLDDEGSVGVRLADDGGFEAALPAGTYGIQVPREDVRDHRTWPPTLDWWWGGRRPVLGGPNVVTVSGTSVTDLGALAVQSPTTLTGHVRDSSGVGLSGAVVSVTLPDGWHPRTRTVRTGPDGEYAILVPSRSASVSVDRSVPGATYPAVVRGTPAQPLEIRADAQVEDFVLSPVWHPSVGAVAGVRDESCLQSSAEELVAELGLQMRRGVLSTARGADWVDPARHGVAIAALEGSDAEMSWGRSPDGSLCFLSVGEDATYQVWLPPVVDGMTDVTINYDRVRTPQVSGGARESRVAGWSDGRTSVVLPGAGSAGDYDDQGRYSLVRRSRGSSQPGRYRFRHIGLPTGVSVENIVKPTIVGDPRPGEVLTADPGTWTVDGKVVDDVVFTYFWRNRLGTTEGPSRRLTSQDGGELMVLIVHAWYQGSWFTAEATAGADVTAPEAEDSVVVETSHGTTSWEVPIVWMGEAQQIVVRGCAGVADPTYTLEFADDTPARSGPMVPGPVDADGLGEYRISLEDLPTTGIARIFTNVPRTCEQGAPFVTVMFYIDPAGSVTDQWGIPLASAEVTLLRSDTEDGDYAPVPAGSDVMSPSNQANPFQSYGGSFRWDVTPGWYQVRTRSEWPSPSCEDGWTVPMEVPPARIDLLVKVECDYGWQPLTAETQITGDAVLGSTLTATPQVRREIPEQVVTTQWFRDLVPIDGATGDSYVVGPYDVGRTLTVEQVVQRAPHLPDDGRGVPVVFDSLLAEDYQFVPGVPIPLPVPPPDTTPTGTPSPTPPPATELPATAATMPSSTALTVLSSRPGPGRARVRVRVRAPGGSVPTGLVEIRRGERVVGRVVMTAADDGRVVLRLARLRQPGAHVVRAAYGGSESVGPSRSKRATVQVRSPRPPRPKVLTTLP